MAPRSRSLTTNDENDDQSRRKIKAARERIRYHYRTPEEREAHNQKRRELYRKRREKEKNLLQKKAAEVASDDLAKIEAIVARRERRAEIERKRYATMSQEKRDEFNRKRCAEIKRKRNEQKAQKAWEPVEKMDSIGDDEESSVGSEVHSS